ncbi:MAG: NAD(P)-dependent oxidoreductase [Alphaproteobacteria bacterium]
MPKTLAMYDAALAHIGPRFEALGLDLEVATFDKDGFYTIGGERKAPEEVEIDYVWFSQQINRDGALKTVFDMALRTKRIGVLQTFNAGLDNPFYAKLSAKGARILNSSAQGVAIAEYTIGQVMAVLQPIEEQRRMQAAKEWRITRFREISQTHWLIAGFGPIGSAIAHRIKAFGAEVSVLRRSRAFSEDADRIGVLADAAEFAKDADVIVLACPLNDATRGMADEAFFKAVKPGAILVNIARGGLIDDKAMIAALDDGRVETAILDVFHTEPLPEDDPLWTHPKVRLTPHTSFAGDGGPGRWEALFLDNIARFANGEPLLQEIDPADII